MASPMIFLSFTLTFFIILLMEAVSLPNWAIRDVVWLYTIIILIIFVVYKRHLPWPRQSKLYYHFTGVIFFLCSDFTGLSNEAFTYYKLYWLIFYFSLTSLWVGIVFFYPTLYMDFFYLHHTEMILLPFVSISEHFIEFYFFPAKMSVYRVVYIILTGLVMMLCGVMMWLVNCITKFDGLYTLFRHPIYVAHFCWDVGLQLVFCNPLSCILYVWVYWKNYTKWIPYEDEIWEFDFITKQDLDKIFTVRTSGEVVDRERNPAVRTSGGVVDRGRNPVVSGNSILGEVVGGARISIEENSAELLNELVEITPNWYLFCSLLGVPTWKLDDFNGSVQAGPNHNSLCFSHALDYWINQDDDVTYNKIVETLESSQISHLRVANGFRERLHNNSS